MLVPLALVSFGVEAQPAAYSEDKIIFDEKNSAEYQWLGTWRATGTLFEINLNLSKGEISIEQVNSMGFDWVSDTVYVKGETLSVELEYGGAKGVVVANIINPSQNYAIASVATCEPSYMLICALSKNKAVTFQRLD